jgi:hypothetical protein
MHPVSVTTIMKGYIGNLISPSTEMDKLPPSPSPSPSPSLPSLLLLAISNLSAPISPSLLAASPNLHLLSSIVPNLLLIALASFTYASVVPAAMTQWHHEGRSYEGNIQNKVQCFPPRFRFPGEFVLACFPRWQSHVCTSFFIR